MVGGKGSREIKQRDREKTNQAGRERTGQHRDEGEHGGCGSEEFISVGASRGRTCALKMSVGAARVWPL